jgi:hypothetical protein
MTVQSALTLALIYLEISLKLVSAILAEESRTLPIFFEQSVFVNKVSVITSDNNVKRTIRENFVLQVISSYS